MKQAFIRGVYAEHRRLAAARRRQRAMEVIEKIEKDREQVETSSLQFNRDVIEARG